MYVLVIEDSPAEVRLTQEAFRVANASIRLHVAGDGVGAFALRREGAYADARRPDCILLDLNLCKMDGREVLAHIKEEAGLKGLPTVILTTSAHDADVVRSYHFHAKCYLNKPVQLDAFESLVKNINQYSLIDAELRPQQSDECGTQS